MNFQHFKRLSAISIVVAGFLWIAIFSLRPIANYDLWWHAATGRYIYSQGHIPTTDPFSFTCRGSRWINNYWLYEVVLYTFFRLYGWAGFLAIKLALILSIFALLLIRCRRAGAGPVTATLAMAAAFWFSRPTPRGWDVDASLVSTFGVSLLLMQLESADLRRKKLGLLWLWPAAFVVWTNAHPGFVIGLALAGIFAVCSAFENTGLAHRLFAWAAACLLATLANPNGWEAYRMLWHGIQKGGIIQNMEWTSFLFYEWGFWATAFCLWLGFYFRYRRGQRSSLWTYAFALSLLWIAIRHNLCVPFFMIFAIPILATWIPQKGALARGLSLEKSWTASLYSSGALVVLFLSVASFRGRPLGVDPHLAPMEACDFIADEGLTDRTFFNEYRFGGYWIWRFFGAPPVFFDSRFPTVEGYIPLVADFVASWRESPERFQRFLATYGVNAALVGYQDLVPAIQDVRFPRRQWALVYWDDTSFVFLKRVHTNDAWIRRLEMKEIYPDIDPDEFIAGVRRQGKPQRQDVRNELAKNLRIHPNSFRTRLLLSAISE